MIMGTKIRRKKNNRKRICEKQDNKLLRINRAVLITAN